ncbi:MAG: hypothetical protein EOP04_19400 [Proteobacteria bacterium]|nr:MAG: hypothetical protein EOP04_19400 [Pseudomonadota bacterium]
MKTLIFSVLLLTACGSSHDDKSKSPTINSTDGTGIGSPVTVQADHSQSPAPIPQAPATPEVSQPKPSPIREIELFNFAPSHYPIEEGENLVFVQDFDIISQTGLAIAPSSIQAFCDDKLITEFKYYLQKSKAVSSVRMTLILTKEDLVCSSDIKILLLNRGNFLEDKGYSIGVVESK